MRLAAHSTAIASTNFCNQLICWHAVAVAVAAAAADPPFWRLLPAYAALPILRSAINTIIYCVRMQLLQQTQQQPTNSTTKRRCDSGKKANQSIACGQLRRIAQEVATLKERKSAKKKQKPKQQTRTQYNN